MKDIIEIKKDLPENAVVYFTDDNVWTKKTTITVVNPYKAYIFVDNKMIVRIDPVNNLNLTKQYGKDYLDKTIKVAYVLNKTLSQILYGFGNIQVNNERLREAYRVGTHGKITLQIDDYGLLMSTFPNHNIITTDDIREKIISIVKTVGTPILASIFTNTNVSVFEASSLIDDVRSELIKELSKESLFKKIGVSLVDVTIDSLYVNEDDMKLIRERLNG